jgi:hypothetical protein
MCPWVGLRWEVPPTVLLAEEPVQTFRLLDALPKRLAIAAEEDTLARLTGNDASYVG